MNYQMNKPLFGIENCLRLDINGAPLHLASQQNKILRMMEQLIDINRITRTDAIMPAGGFDVFSGGQLIWSLEQEGSGDGGLERLKEALFKVFMEFKAIEANKAFKRYLNSVHHPHYQKRPPIFPVHYIGGPNHPHQVSESYFDHTPVHPRASHIPFMISDSPLHHGLMLSPHTPHHMHH